MTNWLEVLVYVIAGTAAVVAIVHLARNRTVEDGMFVLLGIAELPERTFIALRHGRDVADLGEIVSVLVEPDGNRRWGHPPDKSELNGLRSA